MNEDVKVKFIDALLSGEYTQGKGKLRLFNNTVCANGILCELAIKDGSYDFTVGRWTYREKLR